MPTYEYVCTDEACKHEFEDIHSIAAPSPVCERCGKPTKKLVSRPGSILGGDTPKFYRNRG